MILNELLKDINFDFVGNLNVKIKSLFFDSKKAVKNGLFFCLSGTNTNGENFVANAIKNGAVAIVCTKKLDFNITQIIVKDVRKVMAVVSANFFGNPQKKLKIIGITGTNGKTSSSYIIGHILRYNKKRVGVIGTSGIFIKNKQLEAKLTTPDSIELFEIFAKMVRAKIEYVVMEVSAHAIFYNKIYGIDFAVKVLTNVKTDHLDFFKTDVQYQQTKLSFFDSGKRFVVFGDDKIGHRIKQKYPSKTICFGKKKDNDFLITKANFSIGQTSFNLSCGNNCYKIKSNLIGEFNLYNVACAVCVVKMLDKNFDVENAIKTLNGLSGRMQNVSLGQKCKIIIDYAHTYDSLKNLLCTIKKISKNKNIIVFGCPGERDSYKRFKMGKLAGKFCKIVICTSDNPASENARRIMWEMQQGVNQTNAKCFFIENRKNAIKKALCLADENTNVLIVGKGSETYQIVGDKRLFYNDFETVKKIICGK